MADCRDLVYGTGRHRRDHAVRNQNTDDITELGRTAVKGVVTVGAIGITAGLVGGILGSFPKP